VTVYVVCGKCDFGVPIDFTCFEDVVPIDFEAKVCFGVVNHRSIAPNNIINGMTQRPYTNRPLNDSNNIDVVPKRIIHIKRRNIHTSFSINTGTFCILFIYYNIIEFVQ